MLHTMCKATVIRMLRETARSQLMGQDSAACGSEGTGLSKYLTLTGFTETRMKFLPLDVVSHSAPWFLSLALFGRKHGVTQREDGF